MKIYTMNVSGIDLNDRELYKSLSDKRIEKISRLKSETAKRQSIAAELLLNIGMDKERCGVKRPVLWDTDENGKPYLVDYPDIYINMTHSKDYAACVIADAPAGVDIQYMRAVDLSIAGRFFCEEEQKYIKDSENPKNAFYEIWVRKESFIKAVGRGLGIPLGSFSAMSDTVEYGKEKYSFKMHKTADDCYKMCTCVKNL